MKKNWIESQLKRRQGIFGVETVSITEEKQQAIYTVVIDSVIEATRMAKAAGLTGRQVWDCVKIALTEMFGIPESVAAFIIRDAWKQAAIGDTDHDLVQNTAHPYPVCGEVSCQDCRYRRICGSE